jgi:hypothetical protein
VSISDADLNKEVEEMLADARRNDVRRREMSSGQIKKTPKGDIIFKLKVDLPAAISEDEFKKYMVEYANILKEAFESD